MSQWLDCWFAMPLCVWVGLLPLGEPEFGWLEKLSPQADTVPPTNQPPPPPFQYRFKTDISVLHKEADKEV